MRRHSRMVKHLIQPGGTEKTPVFNGDKGIGNLSQNWLLERVEHIRVVSDKPMDSLQVNGELRVGF